MRRVHRIHFVGVGGAGMGGIAQVLHNLGYQVSGSDVHANAMTRRLTEEGIAVHIGHDPSLVDGKDVVVVSSAIANNNPELVQARTARITVVPRAEMLAELMRFKHGIAVAGTHGKTTTTSLIASLLAEGGLDPTFVIGGRLNGAGANGHLGVGQYLVAEADESDASFLYLKPVMAVVTNIDADHLEHYGGDFGRLCTTFTEFLHHLPFYGMAVLCADDPVVRSMLPSISRPILTYGLQQECDVSASEIRYHGCHTHFQVFRPGASARLDISLNLPGRHNVLNALAAIAVALELGVSSEAIYRGLAEFQGIARRSQVLGHVRLGRGRPLLVDDYAHHPREIGATVQGIRAAWPDRRIVVVFQPHRYTRTRDLFTEFVAVLSGVDVLFLLDVYAAGEPPIPGADSQSLCHAIRAQGLVEPRYVKESSKLGEHLRPIVHDDDIVLTLGAGDIGGIAWALASGEKAS